MGTPEHGRGAQRRLSSKLRCSQSCSQDMMPKIQMEGSTRKSMVPLIERESKLPSARHQHHKIFGNEKCCFFQHYFNGQQITLEVNTVCVLSKICILTLYLLIQVACGCCRTLTRKSHLKSGFLLPLDVIFSFL